jgi:hypothetical protein
MTSELQHTETKNGYYTYPGFPRLEQVISIDDHFMEIVQFLSTGMEPSGYTITHKKPLIVCAADFSLRARQLYKIGLDEILRRCVMEAE